MLGLEFNWLYIFLAFAAAFILINSVIIVKYTINRRKLVKAMKEFKQKYDETNAKLEEAKRQFLRSNK